MRQVIIVTLLLVFATLAGLIAGLKYEDEKTLQSRDVYLATKNVTSYSSEAYLIATKSQDQPLVGPYREVYVRQLASNVHEIKDTLATHESTKQVRLQIVRLMAICDRLSDILNTFSRHSDDQVLAAHAAELRTLAKQAEAIEGSL